ncbi:MAG: glycosyltransferase [Luteimonas sp.]|nr:glycosyltransferase [Luteimonas sp.]
MPPLSASAIAAERRDAIEPARATPGPAPIRIRLLLLTDTSIAFSGGSERFLRNLVALLPRDRYDITLVQLDAGHHPDAGRHLPSDTAHATVHGLPVDAIYGRGGWRALRALREMILRERYDIVQSHHEKSDLLNALLPRTPGCVRISNRRDMGYKKSAKLKWLFRFLNRRFDSVIAPAQPILGELARSEALDPARMLWIPNGVDTQRFRPWQGPARSAARQALGLDEHATAYGCIARMTPEKCHADLIAGFAGVHARVPQARLFLIGNGPLRADVEAQISALGLADAVTLLGMRPDIESVLPALDVGLLTSSTEGMSNAILEMMACGLPVIATAVGGNLSLVQPDITGLLVPARQPDALAEAMTRLALSPDLRRRLGAAGRARIEREFSLVAMVQSFDQAYQQLLRST